MRVNARTLGLSAGLVAASTFIVCSVLVAATPGALSNLLSWALHIDLTSMARPISFSSFAGGLILVSSFVAFVVGGTAALYNRLNGKEVNKAA